MLNVSLQTLKKDINQVVLSKIEKPKLN